MRNLERAKTIIGPRYGVREDGIGTYWMRRIGTQIYYFEYWRAGSDYPSGLLVLRKRVGTKLLPWKVRFDTVKVERAPESERDLTDRKYAQGVADPRSPVPPNPLPSPVIG